MATVQKTAGQKIAPCLWFDTNGEEAVKFYTGLFPNSRIVHTMYWGDENPEKKGKVLFIEFELDGQSFQALNGGPEFHFSEAISLSVACEDQAEVDKFWKALIADGGKEVQCGWLKDKFGLSWQIVPKEMFTYMKDPDKAKVARVMKAMMQMVKFDVAKLREAAAGKAA
jgi:two-component system sensor histidine kinase QseC